METKSLPMNLEAEQALLGCLLMNNGAYTRVAAQLRPDMFASLEHQYVYEAISSALTNGTVANPITLKDKLEAKVESAYLAELVGAGVSVVMPDEYAKQISEAHYKRQVLLAFHDIQQMTQSGESLDAIMARVGQVVAASDHMLARNRIRTRSQVIEEIIDDLNSDVASTSTGFPRLDSAMGGGLYPGFMYGLCGRKKRGKTMLAGTISASLNARGHKHLYIACEMGRKQIEMRQLCHRLDMFSSAFRDGFAKRPDNLRKIADEATQGANNVHYWDAPGLSFSDLRQGLVSSIQKLVIEGFILDYIQLIGGKPHGKSTAEHMDEVAQWLAETCKKYNIWGIIVAQINQDGNTRGGEGLRLACEQSYEICKENDEDEDAWLRMMDTRYTAWQDVGSKECRAYRIDPKGPVYIEIEDNGKGYYSFA